MQLLIQVHADAAAEAEADDDAQGARSAYTSLRRDIHCCSCLHNKHPVCMHRCWPRSVHAEPHPAPHRTGPRQRAQRLPSHCTWQARTPWVHASVFVHFVCVGGGAISCMVAWAHEVLHLPSLPSKGVSAMVLFAVLSLLTGLGIGHVLSSLAKKSKPRVCFLDLRQIFCVLYAMGAYTCVCLFSTNCLMGRWTCAWQPP